MESHCYCTTVLYCTCSYSHVAGLAPLLDLAMDGSILVRSVHLLYRVDVAGRSPDPPIIVRPERIPLQQHSACKYACNTG